MRQVEFGSVEEVLEEPAIRWLVPAWLPERELTMLWGREGTYKSFIALDWSLRLAADQKTVVYIVAEGLSGIRARFLAWVTANKVRPDDLTSWHYFNSNIYLNEPGQRKRWLDYLKQYLNPDRHLGKLGARITPDLIVVDTLDRCYDGEENSSRDMGHFIDGVEELRRELDTAVLMIHHSRKEGDKERGTTALPAAVFASLHVSRPTTRPTSGGGSVTIKCLKMKDAEEPPAAKVELGPIQFTHDVEHTTLDEIHQASLVVTKEWSGSRPRIKRRTK